MTFALRIGDRLLSQGILTPAIFEEARARQAKDGGRFGTQLLDMGVISRYTLTNVLNRQHGYRCIRVADDIHVKTNAVAAFPRQIAIRYKLVPIANNPDEFVVGVIDPVASGVLKEAESLMRKPARPVILPESLFHQYRRDYMAVDTDFFKNHQDPSKLPERPFQEGAKQKVPRNLIVFDVAGITLAFFRRNKTGKATRLGDMLVEDAIVTQAEVDASLKNHPGLHLGEALIEDNLVDARILSRYLSQHYRCATIDPYARFNVLPDILKLLDPGTARKFLVVPLAHYEKNLLVLTADPDDEKLLKFVSRETGQTVRPVVTPRACARFWVEHFYPAKAKKK